MKIDKKKQLTLHKPLAKDKSWNNVRWWDFEDYEHPD